MFTPLYRQLTKSTLKGPARKWMDRHVNDPFVKQAKLVYLLFNHFYSKPIEAEQLSSSLK